MSLASTHARAALVLALALFCACSGESRIEHDSERVAIGRNPDRGNRTKLENARSRASEKRVLSDVRDAWTAPIGKTFKVSVATGGPRSMSTAFAVPTGPLSLEDQKLRIGFEVRWKGKGRETIFASESTLGALANAWTPCAIEYDATSDGETTMQFSSRWLDGAADARALADLRAAWSVPSLQGDPSPPFRPSRTDGPNILLISVDTLRADHLGCYGYERATSPSIDRLAASGVLFEHAISSSPWTLPSYGSLFTSLAPGRHGAGFIASREAAWSTADRVGVRTPPAGLCKDVPTLAETLRDAGWRTAGFACNPFLDPAHGVDRGFTEYVSYQYNAVAGVELARKFTERESDQAWFVFLHLIDPHYPYLPPAPYDTKFDEHGIEDLVGYPPSLQDLRKAMPSDADKARLVNMYDGEIAFVDQEIGKLLDSLAARGVLDDTLVIFHSDHGEELWDHGGFEHGQSMYGELLRIPLIVSWPARHPTARRVDTRVRAIDVFPTILDLCGLPAQTGLEGASLVPLMRGEKEADRDALCEFILWGDQEIKACMSAQDKLIARGTAHELFDLASDRAERENLAATRRDVVTNLHAVLASHHAKTAKNACLAASTSPELDASSIDRMKALGYMGTDEASAEQAPARKD